MAVLVTGGAGFIGSQMVHELIDAGERVVALGQHFHWISVGGAASCAARH
jgi:nucleoside-diphosphate-sugar epimerase